MHAEQLAEMLSTHSLFADCGPDELAEIILRGNYMKYDKGHEIMGQGEEGDKLFIMLTGYARTSMIASNGREIVLDYAEAGHVVGEIAFLDGGERTASVHALDNVTALVLTRSAFDEIVSKHQGLAMRLLQSMARRLRQSNSIIEADRAFTSGPRLARYLLRLMLSDPEEERLKLDLSQSELGNFVGLSREQINRQLSSWVESGLIKLDTGRIHILNRDLLLEIAETI
ncbi:Crp/Fnr family transcriptional regulator [Sphingorhabdus sp. Alg239-R122]|uniref:Crp/Fnr family transcriptional regulator n=1 Tax=Sphingorhabdus sp. Alg239-R122 TaxID=2305989 RepID=UPI0019678B18|nr:Crp/Fnr family transcriptional regulator [Sphingorhabdus sp. Alg239-R122]